MVADEGSPLEKEYEAAVAEEKKAVLPNATIVAEVTRWNGSIDASALRHALLNTTLVDAEWLAQLADGGGVIPRCQEVPNEAKVTLEQMAPWGQLERRPRDMEEFGEMYSAVGVLVISYPWLDANHPDINGEQLRRIAFVLRAFAAKAREYSPSCKVGVFWDYCSLPQRSLSCEPGSDDRTPEEQARFGRALKGINTFYGSLFTKVLLVDSPLPEGVYTNTQPYAGRGWCIAEYRMSCIVKHSNNLLAMSTLTGNETSVTELVEQSKPSRPVPLNPDAFFQMLESGVADGSIKFTNKGDVPLVASIYKRAFIDELSAAQGLTYSGLGWGDEALATLLQALVFAEAQGALGNLKQLDLSLNQIGDLGITDFSRQFPIVSMGVLQRLYLNSNQIGDAGMISLSEAIGSMGNLKTLGLHRNQISDTGMVAFANAIKPTPENPMGSLRSLIGLNLKSNIMSDPGMIAFSNAIRNGSMANLRILHLSGNQIGDAGMVDFSRAIASGSDGGAHRTSSLQRQLRSAMRGWASSPAQSPAGRWPAVRLTCISGRKPGKQCAR